VRAIRCVVIFAVVLSLALGAAAGASAAPLWRLSSRAAPSHLAPGATGLLVLTAEDLGDTGVNGEENHVTLRDTLPEGLAVSGGVTALRAHRAYPIHGEAEEAPFWNCSVEGARSVSCTTSLAIPPFEGLEVLVPVEVTDPAGTIAEPVNEFGVSGGVGAEEHAGPVPTATLRRAVQVTGAPVVFGVEAGGYRLTPENDGGSVDSQAGSHPFQLTASVDFNQSVEATPVGEGVPAVKGLQPAAPGLSKDLSFSLPPGLLGAVAAVEQCPEFDFAALGSENVNLCPASSAVGVADVAINIPKPYGYHQFSVPLFNLVPATGEPARFGFEIEKVPVVLDTAVRTSGDYGVTVSVNDASQVGQILGSQVTFWGVPGDPRHDASRGWTCLLGGLYTQKTRPCEAPAERSETAFLTLPTSCAGTLGTTMGGDSWEGERLPDTTSLLSDPLGNPITALEGCAGLPFEPSIATEALQPPEEGQPQTQVTSTDTPTGLRVVVKVPQSSTLDPAGLAEADVRSASVTLPPGVLVSPSAANGLQACTEEQIGYEGPGGSDPLDAGAEEPARFSDEPVACPEAAKIGTVRIKTPLLSEELTGEVYLAAQNANPFGSLLAIYIVAENQRLGLRVKLAGEAKANGETGQLTTTFQDTPQVPFEELQLQLFGGPRAPLTTPPECGTYQTNASFTSWATSTPYPTSSPLEELDITSGPGGAACTDPLPLAPLFSAGVTTLQSGSYTDFTLAIGRPDGQQPLSGVTVHLPPGNAAVLADVTPCEEPQASLGQCGPGSEIGQATAYAGLGPYPYSESGRVYLTGPYDDAPFGLSIVTPAIAGPFNLGDVVVRSKIEVNPSNAAVTISSVLPTFVQGVGMQPSGIPLQLKQIDVTVDRPGFEFNPTSCDPMEITASITGAEGATSAARAPFQVSGCAALPFHPTLKASASGMASRSNGDDFDVKLTSAGLGQANIAKVDLRLPTVLPSRQSTFRHACLLVTFQADPASCPPLSVVGHAVVHTPVLKSPLTGPAYLVSHGGAEFPDVEFVLQGEGITLVLDGKTQIKDGSTYSRFESAPDAPFTTFETELPPGPDSLLTGYVGGKNPLDLCSTKLLMPTTITAQNGDVITQDTHIATTGCGAVLGSRTRKLTTAQELTKALSTCRRKYRRMKRRRQACERQARGRYRLRKHTR
jgi:hypothetical protein